MNARVLISFLLIIFSFNLLADDKDKLPPVHIEDIDMEAVRAHRDQVAIAQRHVEQYLADGKLDPPSEEAIHKQLFEGTLRQGKTVRRKFSTDFRVGAIPERSSFGKYLDRMGTRGLYSLSTHLLTVGIAAGAGLGIDATPFQSALSHYATGVGLVQGLLGWAVTNGFVDLLATMSRMERNTLDYDRINNTPRSSGIARGAISGAVVIGCMEMLNHLL